MHLLLTDILTCPRCGPDFGLIVLSDELENRRVRAGSLGCANCRSSFPIDGGVVDLRHPASPPLVAAPGLDDDPERPLRVAALLGVRGSNAKVMVLEAGGTAAVEVAALLPDVHLVAASTTAAGPAAPEVALVSRIVTGRKLPLRSASLRGLAALGIDVADLVPELGRVLVPGGHLVVERAVHGIADRLIETGFVVHLEQEGVVVAGAPDRR